MAEHQPATIASPQPTFFGHPRGLSTLFFTELWERFSYYGMRAILILYMTDTATGGMGLESGRAGAIYGLYTFGVYVLALPGGWIADRLLGSRKAVLYGGILIAAGHYSMAVPTTATFFLGLFLIVLGTGLLKPNVSAIVGDLYSEKGARRDAGFSIFYMGINIGAFAGPLICSYLGEEIQWHLGFGAAGVGMTLALVQYVLGQKYLEGCGELKGDAAEPSMLAQARGRLLGGLAVAAVVAGAVWALAAGGVLPLTLESFADATGKIVVALAALYFAYIIAFVCRDSVERGRIFVCAMLFIGAALFWYGFEQAGSTMNLFARDATDRIVLGYEVPTGMLQSINPIFIILMAPVMGMLWVKLGARNPSIPVKFAAGLALLGAGFFVLAWGATYVGEGSLAGMQWLIVTYFLHTVGELCLSPVGLSSITKLAPERLVSQMMGTWFMGAALGNLFAGLAARSLEDAPPEQLFTTVATVAVVSGVVFLLLSPLIKKLCHGVN